MQKFYRRILIFMGLVVCLVIGAAVLQSCSQGREAAVKSPEPTAHEQVGSPEETLPETGEAQSSETQKKEPEDGPSPVEPEPEAPEEPMVSEHFGLWEYACDCAGYCSGFPVMPDPGLTERVEALRCACGQPVILTSGVRCAQRNEEVGGVSWSFHKRGRAADLYCPGVAVGDLAAMAKAVGLNVLPYYSSGYVHVELTE
ncbi:D-Ala-D-Ala carboxypeptidase family metallohydrolase [Eubacterium sp. 1001713B170207_170306_E7]|uniref:YcbK family protein n=1 Tax=Eubacterium sp. 1001713B170207_170306_E7 TaxID=2787097 RepID=UPI00189818D0|nr:D-Ala-D-Ala carboxypeptidase family metallohydrolase [Eubacterium sp. 1001713B170207_170306_E7]